MKILEIFEEYRRILRKFPEFSAERREFRPTNPSPLSFWREWRELLSSPLPLWLTHAQAKYKALGKTFQILTPKHLSVVVPQKGALLILHAFSRFVWDFAKGDGAPHKDLRIYVSIQEIEKRLTTTVFLFHSLPIPHAGYRGFQEPIPFHEQLPSKDLPSYERGFQFRWRYAYQAPESNSLLLPK